MRRRRALARARDLAQSDGHAVGRERTEHRPAKRLAGFDGHAERRRLHGRAARRACDRGGEARMARAAACEDDFVGAALSHKSANAGADGLGRRCEQVLGAQGRGVRRRPCWQLIARAERSAAAAAAAAKLRGESAQRRLVNCPAAGRGAVGVERRAEHGARARVEQLVAHTDVRAADAGDLQQQLALILVLGWRGRRGSGKQRHICEAAEIDHGAPHAGRAK